MSFSVTKIYVNYQVIAPAWFVYNLVLTFAHKPLYLDGNGLSLRTSYDFGGDSDSSDYSKYVLTYPSF